MSESPKALGTNPKDLLGILKVDLSSVPPVSILYEALGMQDGKVKYGAFNWRLKKVIASIYYAAAKRHLDAWFDGQENAEDSGYPHLGHAKACIGIVIDALETGNLVDDRPEKGTYAAVLAKWNAFMKDRAAPKKPAPEKDKLVFIEDDGTVRDATPAEIDAYEVKEGKPRSQWPLYCEQCAGPCKYS